jgi:hypothetical protein
LRLGVVDHDAVERDRVADDRTVQAQQPGMVAAGVFRGKITIETSAKALRSL